jgi:hypothetical protein
MPTDPKNPNDAEESEGSESEFEGSESESEAIHCIKMLSMN